MVGTISNAFQRVAYLLGRERMFTQRLRTLHCSARRLWSFREFQPWSRPSRPVGYFAANRTDTKCSAEPLYGPRSPGVEFQNSSPNYGGSRLSDVDILRRYNKALDYHRTIAHFEASIPASTSLPWAERLQVVDESLVQEYIKALIATKSLHRLSSSPAGISPEPLPGGTSTAAPKMIIPEFRLRLDDHADRPLKVAIKSTHRPYHLLVDIIKYAISILLCLAAASIVVERVAENLPKGLGLGAGKKVNAVTDIKETLNDVKGCDEVKEELQEIISYLSNPEKFTRLGAKLPKGVLLAGLPGTGKTLLARAIAGEAKVPFIQSSAAEFEEMFVGVGARRVRDLFATARKMAPVIVFIDEIDAVGSRRAFKDSSSARMTLNQLLVELDGFEQNEGVVVMCATNSPEALDPALTRPGRLDKTIDVPLPDLLGREEILQLYASRVVLGNDVDLKALARITAGMTGADLYNLINIAAVRCSAEDKPSISMEALESALDRVKVGLERRNPMSSEEKRVTSVHEAGHALVSWFTTGSDPVYKATIMPRGSSLGVTWHVPETDRYQRKLYELEAQLAVSMGGRAAEELVFGSKNVTSGCAGDLKAATSLARAMVMQFGMGLGNTKVPMYIDSYQGLSHELRAKVDAAVQRLIDEAYARALAVLKSRDVELARLSEALLEYETINREEIMLAIEGHADNIPQQRRRVKAAEPSSKTASFSLFDKRRTSSGTASTNTASSSSTSDATASS